MGGKEVTTLGYFYVQMSQQPVLAIILRAGWQCIMVYCFFDKADNAFISAYVTTGMGV